MLQDIFLLFYHRGCGHSDGQPKGKQKFLLIGKLFTNPNKKNPIRSHLRENLEYQKAEIKLIIGDYLKEETTYKMVTE